MIRHLILEGRIDDAKARYPEHEEEIDYLVRNDPSGNNKYLMWAAKMVAAGEDEREVAYLLTGFDDNLSKIQQKDINTYKSLAELEVATDQAEQQVSATQQKRQKKEQGIKKIHEDDHWLVVEPLTWDAACIYGRGTKWCISAKDQPVHWETYKRFGAAFAFIFDKTKDETDRLYKMTLTVHSEEIAEGARERWAESGEYGRQAWLEGLRQQFNTELTYEQLESMVEHGAEVSDAENNRVSVDELQAIIGTDLWHHIRQNVQAEDRPMPSQEEMEAAMRAQGIEMPMESVLRQTIRAILIR